ncbi:MAG TPA: DUF4249 domain-containing protein [Mariniphaga anaerophila]|uniref:DUF4249 domain-containing protein n=1 Tax=Mariniphaga anaerophila TaxID=1484053 RepID=A0A831PJK9_9BACT|nr:DUF4249 domain-containing protein [Mariniphaga anaerophila]
MRKHFFNLLIALVIISCEEEVSFNFEHQPKLNLNCILNPDSMVTATLTLSQSLDSPEKIKPVYGAIITLYEENQVIGILKETEGGYYKLDKKPREGKKYNITVESTGYSSVSAVTVIPNRPEIEYTKEITGHLEYDSTRATFNLNVKINDRPGPDNYWIYDTWVVNEVRYGGARKEINAPFLDGFNKITDPEAKYGYILSLGVRLSDEGYDGKTMEFVIPDYFEGTQYSYTDAVHFLNACEHYDKHLKTIILNRMKETSELPFFEPVQIYSNIENGYGIFGSCAITTIYF